MRTSTLKHHSFTNQSGPNRNASYAIHFHHDSAIPDSGPITSASKRASPISGSLSTPAATGSACSPPSTRTRYTTSRSPRTSSIPVSSLCANPPPWFACYAPAHPCSPADLASAQQHRPPANTSDGTAPSCIPRRATLGPRLRPRCSTRKHFGGRPSRPRIRLQVSR